jgi:peptide/nickel transport system substrate-binding protein
MARAAGYNGQRIRFLVSQQYEFHYKIALVATENMRAAGFTVDLQVLDWATLLQRRNESPLWEIFITHGPILPEPSLYGFFNPQSAGWWTGPERDRVLNAFNAESNPRARAAMWADVQRLLYQEVPQIRVGNFNALAARSKRLANVTPAPWPFFWNTWLQA